MTSKEASTSEAKLEPAIVDFNYRALRILIFKNGEEYDNGLQVIISRRQFRHWIKLLDYLSRKLEMGSAIHKIYRLDGIEVNTFDELENNGYYVAVTHGPYIQLDYGTHLKSDEKDKLKRWNYDPKLDKKGFGSLDSAESIDIYLKRCGYESITGLPFPFDELRSSSVITDANIPAQQKPVAMNAHVSAHFKPLLDIPKAKSSKVKDVTSKSADEVDRGAEAVQNQELSQNVDSNKGNDNMEYNAEKNDTQNELSKKENIGQKAAFETNSNLTSDVPSNLCSTQETALSPEELPRKADEDESRNRETGVEVLRYNPDHVYIPLAPKPAISPSNSSVDMPVSVQQTAKSPPMQPRAQSTVKSPTVQRAAQPPFVEHGAKSLSVQFLAQPPFIQPMAKSLSVQSIAKSPFAQPTAKSPPVQPMAQPAFVQCTAKSPDVQPVAQSPFVHSTAKSPPVQPLVQPTFVLSTAKFPPVQPTVNSSGNDEDMDIPPQESTSRPEKSGKKVGGIHFAAHPQVIEFPRYLSSPNLGPYLRKTSFYDTKKVRPPRPMYFDPDFSDFDFF